MRYILALSITVLLFTSCGEKVSEEIKVKSTKEKNTSGDTFTKQKIPTQKEDSTQTVKTEASGETEKESIVSSIKAGNFVGEEKTVRGFVADVHQTKKVKYLNFDDKYPNNSFTGVVFARSFNKFPDLQKYEGENVEITGEITLYNGKPQIILNDESQIRIIK